MRYCYDAISFRYIGIIYDDYEMPGTTVIPVDEEKKDYAYYNPKTDEWYYVEPEPDKEETDFPYFETIDADEAVDILYGLYVQAVNCVGGTETHEKTGGVTVLIPCYGKALYVKEAVTSCLEQTMKAEKIIVLLMDDDSIAMKDELESLDDAVKCVVHERMNVCKAREHLVSLCPTEHFIFLDADDLLFPDYIKSVWNCDSNVVFTNLKHKVGDEYAYTSAPDKCAYNALKQNPTALWSKTVFNDLGGFDEYFSKGCEDTDLIIKLLKSNWKCRYINEPLFAYRLETENSLTLADEFDGMKLKLFNRHKEWFMDKLRGNDTTSYPDWMYELPLDKELTKEDCLDILREAKHLEIKAKHRCTFILDKRCNTNCEYCYQLKDADRNLVLSDDEWFDRFDKALRKAEEVYPDGIKVQIMGGEPSLWSDSLVERIIKRLHDYESFTLFSNGINKNSKWFSHPKTLMSWHITDWNKDSKIDEFYKSISDKNVIVVEPKDIEKLDSFLTKNCDTKFMIAGSGCAGSGAEETRCSFEDMKKIAEICQKHDNTYDDIPEFVEIVENNGLEDAQRRCREFGSVTTFNLGTMLVSPCNKADVIKIPLDEWNGPEYNCENCMWFCGGM